MKYDISNISKKIGYQAFSAKKPKENALAEGYSLMSSVNLALAEEGLSCDSEALLRCEQILAESEYQMVKRGDIYYADLSPVVGSEQGGIRPVLIIQNDVGNKYSPTVIATAITSQINKAKMPTHIELDANEYGLSKDSVVLAEQIRTIDKQRLKEKIGHLDDKRMRKVNEALEISFGLTT